MVLSNKGHDNYNDADLVDKLFGLKETLNAKERIEKKLTDRDLGGKFSTQVKKHKKQKNECYLATLYQIWYRVVLL